MASDSEKITSLTRIEFVDLGALMDSDSSEVDSDSEEEHEPLRASSINPPTALLGACLSFVGMLGAWLYSKRK
jgi:hypothetical protein